LKLVLVLFALPSERDQDLVKEEAVPFPRMPPKSQHRYQAKDDDEAKSTDQHESFFLLTVT